MKAEQKKKAEQRARMDEVEKVVNPFIRLNISTLEKEELDPSIVKYEILKELRVTESRIKEALVIRTAENMDMAASEWLRRRMNVKVRYSIKVFNIFFRCLLDLIIAKLKRIHGIMGASTSFLDSNPDVSELFKETLDKITTIRRDTVTRLRKEKKRLRKEKKETAEGSQSELISDQMGIEKEAQDLILEETSEMRDQEGYISCIEKAQDLLEETSEMGEEGDIISCIDKAPAAESEEESAEEMMEKLQTDQFLDICSRMFLAGLSNLFSRQYRHEYTTSLSPMHFTHTTPPGDAATVATTLQIFSIKIQEINEEALGSNWPLRVYGTVAARDAVDRNRNVLFHRARDNCQSLKERDPFLHLTGPSRAIVATHPVDFEIQLKVKGRGRNASEDRVLMWQTFVYSGNETTTTLLSNDYCKIMLQCAKLENTVQATVVAVRVINWRKRAWPFNNGGKVYCVAKGSLKEEEVVLQDQLEASTSHDGYLDLSRRVVSVELNGQLRVSISSSKRTGHVLFPAQECKSSRRKCRLGPYEVEVTVAWSLVVRDKRCFILREECVDDGQSFEHTAEKIQRRDTRLETRSAREIYSLLDLISKNSMKLKTEAKLRISDYSISEIQIHMDALYRDVTNLLRMMENVHNNRGQEPVTKKMCVKIRTEDKGESATEMQAPGTYYKYGSNAIFNGLDQICTQLDQMGLLSYKGKSQSFSSSTDIKMEIEEAKKMGWEDKDGDTPLTEQESFESYRRGWVSSWSISCGTFTETTSLSSMHFTHSMPGHTPFGALVDSTLQIYSIKVTKIEDGSGLKWPLRVYGVVAARDTVDRNRNIIFSRQRNNCQILTPQDPFLRLTGPSRAIVTREPARVEIELKVKGTTKSEDRVLMSRSWYHSSLNSYGLRTLYIPIEGHYCTMVLSLEQLGDSVQATIVGIRVRVPEGRPSPFEYGGRVVCSSQPQREGKLPDSQDIADDPSFRQVVLQDGEMSICSKGYLNLSRHVVSVQLGRKLELVIEARTQSGTIAGQVSIDAQECNITDDVCHLGDSELEITVAWSRLVREKSWVS